MPLFGDFEILRGEKVALDSKTRKFYLLDILYIHQYKQNFLIKFL
jgi:hypothetical protein